MFNLIMILSNNNTVASIVCTFSYAVNPAVISNIIYFRMYFMLSAIISAYLLVHIKMLKDYKVSCIRLALLIVLGTMGFLTHYHMLFAIVVAGVLFVIYFFFFRKEYLITLLYCLSVGMIIILEYLLWPIFIAHIFIGYRGKGAIDSITNINGYLGKMRFMWDSLNGNLYGYLLPLVLLLLVTILIVRLTQRYFKTGLKCDDYGIVSIIERNRMYIFAIVSCLGYIVATSITGLESNRFLFPTEGILVATLTYFIFIGIYELTNLKIPTVKGRLLMSSMVCVCFSVIITISAIYHEKIDYLFWDRRIVNEAVYSNENDRIVVFQKIWYDRLIDYYPEFSKVYFCGDDISINKASEDLSEYLINHKNVLIFVEESREQKEVFKVLQKACNSSISMELIGDANEFFEVYVLNGD